MQTFFDLETVNSMRRCASNLLMRTARKPGWQKSECDLNAVVSKFPGLRLRLGYKLAAYEFVTDSGGWGHVYGIPTDSELPNPESLTEDVTRFYLDRPEIAKSHRSVIELDGSTVSFISASLLTRALEEFGKTAWSEDWDAETIVGTSPFEQPPEPPPHVLRFSLPPAAAWSWLRKEPRAWLPCVDQSRVVTRVTFWTCAAAGTWRIHQHVDFYSRRYDKIWPRNSKRFLAAKGPAGYIR
jgi:hypothetical protein